MPTLKMGNRDLGEYISGFVDGEGCFSVSFSKRSKRRKYSRKEILGYARVQMKI